MKTKYVNTLNINGENTDLFVIDGNKYAFGRTVNGYKTINKIISGDTEFISYYKS